MPPLATARVPDEIEEALREVNDEPEPLNVVAVIVAAVKLPDASLATIVDAPFEDEAVVLALAIVPAVIASALSEVRDVPLPLKDVPVIAAAAKLPEASRKTSVLAPLDADPVVLALAIVPEEIASALIEVRDAPEPLKVVAVIIAPAKLPEASRDTMVDAPLLDEAEVRALSKVPLLILEAFRLVILAPENDAVADPVPPDAIGRGLVNIKFPVELTFIAVVPAT